MSLYHSSVDLPLNTLRSGFLKIPLTMAAIGAVETFGLAINHGPRPSSPGEENNFNNKDENIQDLGYISF